MLTLGSRTPNFAQGDILIEDGRVAEVGTGLRARNAEVVDATDTIVMPGFVDTHRHLAASLFRNEGGSGRADAVGPLLEPGDTYAATLVGLLGAIEAGITTVVDWAETGAGTSSAEAALQAHEDSGLRTVFVTSRVDNGRVERHQGASTTLAFASEGPAVDNRDRIARGWNAAREAGRRIHAHAGLDASSRGSIAELGRTGLLGPDVTLVHGTRLCDSDLDAAASAGVGISLTPSTEMASGLGMPPIQELINRGIRPGLGVDDERIAPGDIFAQMRATISIQHAIRFDLKLAGKAGLPRLLSTRDVIRYATVDGARVAGLGDVTGALEPGRLADIVVLRTDRPNIVPVNDPIGAVVWGMDTSNIDSVFVGGRALMRDGMLEADGARVRDLAAAAHQRVVVDRRPRAGAAHGAKE